MRQVISQELHTDAWTREHNRIEPWRNPRSQGLVGRRKFYAEAKSIQMQIVQQRSEPQRPADYKSSRPKAFSNIFLSTSPRFTFLAIRSSRANSPYSSSPSCTRIRSPALELSLTSDAS